MAWYILVVSWYIVESPLLTTVDMSKAELCSEINNWEHSLSWRFTGVCISVSKVIINPSLVWANIHWNCELSYKWLLPQKSSHVTVLARYNLIGLILKTKTKGCTTTAIVSYCSSFLLSLILCHSICTLSFHFGFGYLADDIDSLHYWKVQGQVVRNPIKLILGYRKF